MASCAQSIQTYYQGQLANVENTNKVSKPALDALLRSIDGFVRYRVVQIGEYEYASLASGKTQCCVGLAKACNGLVLRSDGEIVAAPSPVMSLDRESRDKIVPNWDRYEFYLANDATRVTLYYGGGQWHLASNLCAIADDTAYYSDRTYRELFDELAANYRWDYDALNTEYSYNLCFRHHAIHPFRADPQGLWLVNIIDKSGNLVTDCPIKLPMQKRHRAPQHASAVSNFKFMMRTNRTALEHWENYGGAVHYGFICRADTAELPDVFLPSSFHNYIRTVTYGVRMGPGISPRDFIFHAVCAYLKSDRLFFDIFPQYWAPVHVRLDYLTRQIAAELYESLSIGGPLANDDQSGSKFREAALEIAAKIPRADLRADLIWDLMLDIPAANYMELIDREMKTSDESQNKAKNKTKRDDRQ